MLTFKPNKETRWQELKKMNSSIELIRLIAVILIVFTHTRNELESGVTYFIIERLPTFGTALLSLISGYLYYNVSRKKNHLFKKKIKSLAVPYLIANTSILLVVLIFYYTFGYNALHRLSYDFSIISEGIFALNSPPINPPTYFIRDIFVIFSIIALLTQKELKALFILIPITLFGTLILRLDVAFLFLVGCIYSQFENKFKKKTLIILTIIITTIIGAWFSDYLKFPTSFLIFILLINLQFKFYNTGRYSYLLHLYHSPIIVITYPILNLYIDNPLLKIIAQIMTALLFIYMIFLISKKYEFLKILSGGR